MDFFSIILHSLWSIVDFIIHIDHHLLVLTAEYPVWIYGILMLIIFAETGLVFTPFLPGDSLLFAAGALAAQGHPNIQILCLSLTIMAIVGDAVNYSIGRFAGKRIIAMNLPVITPARIAQTESAFARYGNRAIVIARFIPIVRTFAPFLAGIGRMHYATFAWYNALGGIIWVNVFLLAGYFFGNIPAVKERFGLVIIVIIIISLVPLVYEWWQHRKARI